MLIHQYEHEHKHFDYPKHPQFKQRVGDKHNYFTMNWMWLTNPWEAFKRWYAESDAESEGDLAEAVHDPLRPICAQCGRSVGRGPELEETLCGRVTHHGACATTHFLECKQCRDQTSREHEEAMRKREWI